MARFKLKKPFRPQFSDLEVLLLSFALFGCALVAVRTGIMRNDEYIFMPYNLLIAAIPLGISKLICLKQPKGWKMWTSLIVWLLFLPNSFYILTDLFHLRERIGVPMWFDLALIISFAWTGLLYGVMSIRNIERFLRQQGLMKSQFLFIFILMMLNGLGIYLGRYLRYNSWDVITNPFRLAGSVLYILIHPFRSKEEIGMIVCFGLLLLLIYQSLRKIGRTSFL